MTDDDARCPQACPHCGEAIVELPLQGADATCPACGLSPAMPDSGQMTDAEWESLLAVAETLSLDDSSECDPTYDPLPAFPNTNTPF